MSDEKKPKVEDEDLVNADLNGDWAAPPPVVIPSSSEVSTPGAPAAAGQYSPQQKGSGRFTNIGKYLQANQGAGERVTGRVAREGQEGVSALQKGIESSKAKYAGPQGEIGQLQSRLGQGVEAGKQMFLDPSQQGNLEQFQQVYGGDIGQQARDLGGQIQQDLGGYDAQAQGVQDFADKAKTSQGRFGLLQQTFGQPGRRYGAGQQRLDELFMQATPESRQFGQQLSSQAQAAQQQSKMLGEELGTQMGGLPEEAVAKQQALKDMFRTGQFGEEDLGEGYEDIQQSLESRMAEKQASADALRAGMGQGQYGDEILQGLGLEQGRSLFGLDPSSYIGQGVQQATATGVASPEEIKRLQSLQRLSGVEGGYLSGADAESAGGYSPFDYSGKDQFQQELAGKEAAFAQEFSPLNRAVDVLNKAKLENRELSRSEQLMLKAAGVYNKDFEESYADYGGVDVYDDYVKLAQKKMGDVATKHGAFSNIDKTGQMSDRQLSDLISRYSGYNPVTQQQKDMVAGSPTPTGSAGKYS